MHVLESVGTVNVAVEPRAFAARWSPESSVGEGAAGDIDGAVTRKRNRSRRRLRGDSGQRGGEMGRGWQQFHETIVGGIRHEQIQRVVERESAVRARHGDAVDRWCTGSLSFSAPVALS